MQQKLIYNHILYLLLAKNQIPQTDDIFLAEIDSFLLIYKKV